MRAFLRWLGCALRGHPYPRIPAVIDWADPLMREPPRCSHCRADLSTPTRGMHS